MTTQIGPSTRTYRSVTGEEYVCFPIEIEGEEIPDKHKGKTEEEAWALFLIWYSEYAESKPKDVTLYFRVAPRYEPEYQCIYARLLLSNRKPESE